MIELAQGEHNLNSTLLEHVGDFSPPYRIVFVTFVYGSNWYPIVPQGFLFQLSPFDNYF